MNQKNVLMLSVKFFGYEEKIKNVIEELGYHVDMYDQRPSNGFVGKACVRYNVGLYRPEINRYFEKLIANNEGKRYDYVFVIKGEAVTEEVLAMLRKAYPAAKFILYLWDSVVNIPECEKRMKLYDRVLTFDPQDAQDYQLLFRPLFFMKEYENQIQTGEAYEYDFAFIGTAHTIRPRIVKQIGEACKARGSDYFSYLFLPHKLIYLYNKVINRNYRTVQLDDIRFTPMQPDEIRSVYNKTRCVLDVEHQKQRGLTMRTIELVGMQKKIITTNAGVKEYDFYNPSNICVIDRENPVVDDAFWEKAYEPIPEEILRRYALKSFVKEIFEI